MRNGFLWVHHTRARWREDLGVKGQGDGEISWQGRGVQNRLKTYSKFSLSGCPFSYIYFILSFSTFFSLSSPPPPPLHFYSSLSLSLSGSFPNHRLFPFLNFSSRLFRFFLSILLIYLSIFQLLFLFPPSLTKVDKELKVHFFFFWLICFETILLDFLLL